MVALVAKFLAANTTEKSNLCLKTIISYLSNIVSHPGDAKYRTIKFSNKVFVDRVLGASLGLELLQAGPAQFVLQGTLGNEGAILVACCEALPADVLHVNIFVKFLTLLCN